MPDTTPNNTGSISPFRIGQAVLVRTVTHYHTGVIAEINKDHIVLERAAWIADTGRFHDALARGTLAQIEPFPDPVAVMKGGIIDVTVWRHELPNAQR